MNWRDEYKIQVLDEIEQRARDQNYPEGHFVFKVKEKMEEMERDVKRTIPKMMEYIVSRPRKKFFTVSQLRFHSSPGLIKKVALYAVREIVELNPEFSLGQKVTGEPILLR